MNALLVEWDTTPHIKGENLDHSTDNALPCGDAQASRNVRATKAMSVGYVKNVSQ